MAPEDPRLTEHRAAGWGAETLWTQLQPLLPGLSIEVVARADSTNTQLIDRARMQARGKPETGVNYGRRAGDTQPCLLVAEHQTSGRGRFGRSWQAAPGASLTFSLALTLECASLDGLSLAVGVAVAEALDHKGARVMLKWPNDLLLVEDEEHARKLGGVLIESVAVGSQRMVVIGVGINVKPQTVVGDLSSGFACMQELDALIGTPALLAQVALPLVVALRQFEQAGFAAFMQRFHARDLLRGRAVRTTHADMPEGIARGVDATGSLQLDTPQGLRSVSSGEVSVRLLGERTEPGGLA